MKNSEDIQDTPHKRHHLSAFLDKKRRFFLSAAIFIVALLVRAAPLGHYVTPDEPIWVLRAIRFADAVAARDWAAIPQTGHPGITTMALGALGVRITAWLQPTEAAEHLAWLHNLAWLAPENGEAFPHLAFFLPAGRILVMLSCAAGLVLAYHIARPRLGEPTARLLALFLALDPFFGGHAGLLHTDALQATFALLAVLFILPKHKGNITTYPAILGSACCLALAGSTKTLGLLIAPGIAAALFLLDPIPLKKRWGHLALLTIATILCLIIIYPPFWANPVSAVNTLIDAISYHEGGGNRPVFFAGAYHYDPGWAFYPAVLLVRLTPPVLTGLILAGRDKIRARRNQKLYHDSSTAGWFLIPGLLYLGLLATAEKKFDRYTLSAIPMLAAIAASAWARHRSKWQWGLLLSLLLPWALVAPLPLYYADPLLGGPWTAKYLIPLGWNEGSGIAAATAARALDHPETAVLMTDDIPTAAARFPGKTQPYEEAFLPCSTVLISNTPYSSAAPGYTVAAQPRLAGMPLATALIQNSRLPESKPLLIAGPVPGTPQDAWIAPDSDLPTLRTWLNTRLQPGDVFTWVHAPTCFSVTEAQLQTLLAPAATCTPVETSGHFPTDNCTMQSSIPETTAALANFGGDLALVGQALPSTIEAGNTLQLTLRWAPLAPLPPLKVTFALEGDSDTLWRKSESEVIDTRGWSTSNWEVGSLVEQQTKLSLPLRLPPGPYTATVHLCDAAGQNLGVWLPDGTFSGTCRHVGEIAVLVADQAADSAGMQVDKETEAPGLHLLGFTPPPGEIWAGERLPFQLGWERTEGTAGDTLAWSLICEGNQQDGGILAIAPSPPAGWPIGHRYRVYYAPRSNPLLGEAQCELQITPQGGRSISIGQLQVHQRPRTFELATPPQQPLSITVGHAAVLMGFDMAPTTLKSGAPLTITLYWQAKAALEENYTVFVHALGPDGQLHAQSDCQPQDGEAPTTSWIAGQIIVDTHQLTLPPETPPGPYTLLAGLYSAASGSRLPLYDEAGTRLENDQACLTALSVMP